MDRETSRFHMKQLFISYYSKYVSSGIYSFLEIFNENLTSA